MRASNVLTAVSNVSMGFLLSAGSWQPTWALALLTLASSAMYLSGMVLNDLFDREIDLEQRPERPLPSGRVSVTNATVLGASLLLLGIALAFLVTWLQPNPARGDYTGRSGIVAICLAACIIAYDSGGKNSIFGPLLMGGCRFFNVLLGCSICAVKPVFLGFETIQFAVAGAIGIYVAGITMFARFEHTRSPKIYLVNSAVVMFCGIALIASQLPTLTIYEKFGRYTHLSSEGLLFCGALLVLLVFPVGRRILVAIGNPDPKNVQRAVVVSLLTLIMIDAAICYFVAMDRPFYGLAVASLLIPTYWLGRLINPT